MNDDTQPSSRPPTGAKACRALLAFLHVLPEPLQFGRRRGRSAAAAPGPRIFFEGWRPARAPLTLSDLSVSWDRITQEAISSTGGTEAWYRVAPQFARVLTRAGQRRQDGGPVTASPEGLPHFVR